MKTPLPAPNVIDLLAATPADRLRELLSAAVSTTVNGRYRHWDALRHLNPPNDWTSEEWWLAIKLARGQAREQLPITDRDGRPFYLVLPHAALRMLHEVDQRASGSIISPDVVTTPGTSRQYVVDSLIEEAITSSQLEGASTTHRVAKDMIRTGRPPTTRSEQMILNNFRAMQYVSEHRSESLTVPFILEVHRIVTRDTLDDPASAGRIQRPDDERIVVEDESGQVLHVPPPAEELPARLERLCAIANDAVASEGFIHPVVRAIMVHFALAYDHPFEDGNGRTARALFYWSMLHSGYWLAEYLSISRLLNKAHAKYARSFLYSEEDDNDLTYFVLAQLATISRAIDDMHQWLRAKAAEVRQTEQLLRSWRLNHRQSALLGHALRNPGAHYTHKSHSRSHDVTIQSARTDLHALVDLGLLTRRRIGRQDTYWPVRELAQRVHDLDDE